MAQTFTEEMRRLGAEIIVSETYALDVTDFGQPIKRIKDVDLKRYGKLETSPTVMKKGKPVKMYVPGFDAIFLPGDAAKVGLIAGQLQFHGMKVVLLGTNGSSWYSFTASKDWAGLTNSSPYDNVSVGAPGGAHPAYAKVAGTAGGTYLYERSFNRGISLVNPTASSATVPLPAGSWTDLDGGTHSGSITLASHDADVLTGP